jgi:chromate reductase, NAD(P)H dehydrogenase (quinone)
MPAIRLVAFAGSLRTASHNRKLVRIAAAGARSAGAEVTEVDLRDLPMPMYDGDVEREQGLPPNAKVFKRLLSESHGMLIGSPEYNSAFSAVLKNAIDWASRPEPNEPPLVAYKGKIAGLMAASPGQLGGVRGLAVLRAVLAGIGVIVVPTQLAIPRANDAFDADGNLRDAGQHATIEAIAGDVVRFASLLSPAR